MGAPDRGAAGGEPADKDPGVVRPILIRSRQAAQTQATTNISSVGSERNEIKLEIR
jgi:hypothetical protein